MLDTVLQWLGAGDRAIASMGPSVAIALSLLGGFGVTQFLKFPIAKFVTDGWRDYAIRAVAVGSTWAFAHGLGDLPTGVELVVAFGTLYAYKLVNSIVRHYWPWLEAGWILGSAAPSEDAKRAMAERRGP